jgi:hypothetical protein
MKDTICLIDERFDINRIEEGIRKEVALLRQHGIRTISSCGGGGNGHFYKPTIIVGLLHGESATEIRKKIQKVLIEAHYNNFIVSERYCLGECEMRGEGSDNIWYQWSEDLPMIEVEFYAI